MANRVEIGEIVENATGLNITGASVTVKYHGGANAPVYDAENGGSLLSQPLSTTNGKIGADYPSGAWVAANTDYDLLVTFGGDTLTYFWPGTRGIQLVTTLPAGAGTSAPEDGELAMELYDGTNGGAWLRRYRAAVSAWDMIGGPPPSGGSLPGSPRARQEFYLTGGTPPVQHQRYNGSSWDYVGTPPTVPVTGSPLSILEVGQSGQNKAGRQLALVDFTTLAALPTTPVLLANLTTLTSNLGTGGALVNKGTVTNGNGIDGSATAAQFTGSTGQVLYIDDTGAADPFRLKTYTVGCWFRTSKRGTGQHLITKGPSTGVSADFWFTLRISTNNVIASEGPLSGAPVTVNAVSDVCDDRWHHAAVSYDGTQVRVYVDGVLENSAVALSNMALTTNTAPLNIGGFGGNNTTASASPHFGRVDEAFATPDVLSDEQVRLVMAAKIPHGYSTTPTRSELSVRRKRRGAALVSGDFPSQPVRLHSLVAGALTDAGSGAVALTATNSPVTVAGPDGTKDDAYNFVAASTQQLSSTDTGLPAAVGSARSIGCWLKTSTLAAIFAIGYGTGGAPFAVGAGATGVLTTTDGVTNITGNFVADGRWHFVVFVADNSAIDGLKTKLYCDGALVGSSVNFAATTLAGAGGFKIGCLSGGTNFWTGQISRAFVHSVALTSEQIQALYQKSSQTLVGSIKSDAGANIEAMDATNVYAILTDIDSNNTIDLAVAA